MEQRPLAPRVVHHEVADMLAVVPREHERQVDAAGQVEQDRPLAEHNDRPVPQVEWVGEPTDVGYAG